MSINNGDIIIRTFSIVRFRQDDDFLDDAKPSFFSPEIIGLANLRNRLFDIFRFSLPIFDLYRDSIFYAQRARHGNQDVRAVLLFIAPPVRSTW